VPLVSKQRLSRATTPYTNVPNSHENLFDDRSVQSRRAGVSRPSLNNVRFALFGHGIVDQSNYLMPTSMILLERTGADC
jgi:hypothetical protein